MEMTFSELRAKEVVNVQDGRRLGRVCDIVLCYPENKWLGIVVPGKGGFIRKKNELYIDLRNIQKIGEDVILVNVGMPRPSKGDKRGHGMPVSAASADREFENGGFGGTRGARNYEEFE